MTTPITGGYNSIFFISDDVGYIAGQFETGNLPLIMKTTDAGDTWIEQPQSEVGFLHSIFFVGSDTGYACGRVGLMLKTTTGGVTGVGDKFSQPNDFVLYQNYPNPFNPSTKISWQSPVSSHQTLKIYDVLGNEVAALVNEYKPTGSYEVEVKAEGLSSGIYFYRLLANDLVETKQMMLLR